VTDDKTKRLSVLKSIKVYCFDCSGQSRKEVELCEMDDCPLFPFRFGKNPHLRGRRRGGNPDISSLHKRKNNSKILLDSSENSHSAGSPGE
jgi:hypothetical protein